MLKIQSGSESSSIKSSQPAGNASPQRLHPRSDFIPPKTYFYTHLIRLLSRHSHFLVIPTGTESERANDGDHEYTSFLMAMKLEAP